jgi:hypothetical protein
MHAHSNSPAEDVADISVIAMCGFFYYVLNFFSYFENFLHPDPNLGGSQAVAIATTNT